jgi:hypothetical protein
MTAHFPGASDSAGVAVVAALSVVSRAWRRLVAGHVVGLARRPLVPQAAMVGGENDEHVRGGAGTIERGEQGAHGCIGLRREVRAATRARPAAPLRARHHGQMRRGFRLALARSPSPAGLAALTRVASTILCLDETVTKE